MFKVPEEHRVKGGVMGSDESYGNNGAFLVPLHQSIAWVNIIASDGAGWEHVSVHMVINGEQKTPTWPVMCMVKNLFWDDEDCVIQYHPPKSKYVNNHKHVLHLWKPAGFDIPTPPTILIGTV
jgi:hypothetical protein